ncbi:Transposon Tn3 resolvase [Trueperella bialowiezensis]|uniref:Transposon Tn3 resolvase n=2 Tax=Trueperella bialowiezensis TaxID=312285 RepID=A0A3S4YYW2_9ACTO|nr:Transposon Tn3 resolvase [Trueperella bialowiezensis]
MKKIERITPPQAGQQLKKVAAYARISAETERTPTSLSAQVSHYSALIQSTPGWQYAGVYADSGISGTTTNRPRFQDMLSAARDGQIDLILTKSISRFARNTVDLLETVRELKELNVEVYFEKENISSLSADGELMLTLLASFAQAESEQISNNVKWRVWKGFEEGKANGFHLYGYTDSADATDVEIIEDEAAVVRWIFDQYMKQVSCEKMAAQLINDNRVPHLADNKAPGEWVRHILKNPAYTGDLLLGRWATPEGKPGRAVPNTGQHPKYLVKNAIPAIIDHDTFQKVQEEIAQRRELGARANWSIPTTCFTSVIKCGRCGMSYSRSGKRSTNGNINYVWLCRTKRNGPKRSKGRTCDNKMIPEPTLQEVCCEVLNIDQFDPDTFSQRVKHIEIPGPNLITFHLADGTIIEREWQSNQRAKSWTTERRKEWGEYQKQRWTDDMRAKRGEQTRRRATPQRRAEHSQKMRQWYANPENKAKHQAIMADIRKRKKSERDA